MGLAKKQDEYFDPSKKITLKYRIHVKISYWFLIGMATLMTISLLPGIISNWKTFPELILPAILFLQAKYLAKPLAYSKIHLQNDSIEIEHPSRPIKFSCAEIKIIRRRVIPFIGGYVTLELKDGKKYRFTAVLEHPEYLYEFIFKNRPELDDGKFARSKRHLAAAELNWSRFYRQLTDKSQWIMFFATIFACSFIKVPIILFIGLTVAWWYVQEVTLMIWQNRVLKKNPSATEFSQSLETKLNLVCWCGLWISLLIVRFV